MLTTTIAAKYVHKYFFSTYVFNSSIKTPHHQDRAFIKQYQLLLAKVLSHLTF